MAKNPQKIELTVNRFGSTKIHFLGLFIGSPPVAALPLRWRAGLVIILIVAAFVALAARAWWLAVRRIYRLSSEPASRLTVTATDGWKLALYHRRSSRRRFLEPVLLCHGLAANHRNLEFEPPYSVAHALAEAGFECFIAEWRGIGESRRAPRGLRGWSVTVDDFIREDGPAFLAEALARAGAPRAFWVGHSMGGVVGYAVGQSSAADRLAGLVTLGTPVSFRYPSHFLKLLSVAHLASWPFGFPHRLFPVMAAPFMGRVALPFSDAVMNPEHIPGPQLRKLYANVLTSMGRGVLAQFGDWLMHDELRSVDRSVDYRAGLRSVRVPALVVGGSADRLAPPEVVTQAFDLLGSEDKTLVMFGRDRGDPVDYGHGDLVFGEGAPTAVYPVIRAWLERHATPLD